jgi:hypothetical protein
MAISQSFIKAAKGSVRESIELASTKIRADSNNIKSAFLSHSHKDSELAAALQDFLWKQGWRIYIDWQDGTMPDNPNKETAEKIQRRIKDNNWFIFLATNNSVSSRWCPWELGYADEVRGKSQIVIIPTSDSAGNYGNEYFELYRRIDIDKENKIREFSPGFYYTSNSLSGL